jgi:hypothetical protein
MFDRKSIEEEQSSPRLFNYSEIMLHRCKNFYFNVFDVFDVDGVFNEVVQFGK